MRPNHDTVQDPHWLPPDRPQVQIHALIRRIQLLHLREYRQPVAVMWRQDIQEVYFFHCPNRVPHFEWWLPESLFSPSFGSGDLKIEAIFQDPGLNRAYAQIQRKASLDTLSGEFHSVPLNQILREDDVRDGSPHPRTVAHDWPVNAAPDTFALSRLLRCKEAFHLSENSLVRYLQEIHLLQHGEPLAVHFKAHESGSLSHHYIPNRFPRCEWQISWDLAEKMLWDPEYRDRFIFSVRKQMRIYAQNYSHHREKALPNALYGGGGYTLFERPPLFIDGPIGPHSPA